MLFACDDDDGRTGVSENDDVYLWTNRRRCAMCIPYKRDINTSQAITYIMLLFCTTVMCVCTSRSLILLWKYTCVMYFCDFIYAENFTVA